MMVTDEQLITVRKLSYILGKSEQEILNTPYEKIIRLLVDKFGVVVSESELNH